MRDKKIEEKDISGSIAAPKEESRLASEHKPHVSAENKLGRFMPKSGSKPNLGPRTSG